MSTIVTTINLDSSDLHRHRAHILLTFLTILGV